MQALGGASLLLAGLAACSGEPPGGTDAPRPVSSDPSEKSAPATPPRGLWQEVRPDLVDPSPDAAQQELIARLEAIGYATGTRNAPRRRGVTVHDRARAQPGYNFYTSGHAPEAILMDMNGNTLHRWRHEFHDIWPDDPREWTHVGTGYWRRAHLLPDGDVIAIYEGSGIVRLDADSRRVWANPIQAHHDLEVMENGEVYVLTRKARVVPEIHTEKPVLEDFVSILDENGVETRRVSLLRALRRSDFADRFELDVEGSWGGDIFHTNTLEVLDGRIADRYPAFAAGNVLVSILQLDAIAVVDLHREEIVWMRQGSFQDQHDPTVLPNGNLLLFDNRGADGRSRILEFAPDADEPVWVHRDGPGAPFFSATCGTAQRLPNGNTLATESDAGRAFEVTRDGEIVWEFVSPHRAGERDELIATLFEMRRLPPDFPLAWTSSP